MRRPARSPSTKRPHSREVEDGTVPVAENADLSDDDCGEHTEEGARCSRTDLDARSPARNCSPRWILCCPAHPPAGRVSRIRRPAGKRRADALGQRCGPYLSHSHRPMSGGVLPHRHLDPARRPGSSTPSVLPGHQRRHRRPQSHCDSTLGTVIVDGDGVPLDVGTQRATVPPAIRKGLAIRDGGCAHLAAGGRCPGATPTTSSRGAAAARPASITACCCAEHHHTAIHHGGWQVYLGPRPPPLVHPHLHKPGASRTGTPAPHARRTMTDLPTAA